jgi:branched-chain amino acid transport system substrate-binding protein
MITRRTLMAAAGLAMGGLVAIPAAAQETVKIGLILPMTAPRC